jgi:hypothetical protein
VRSPATPRRPRIRAAKARPGGGAARPFALLLLGLCWGGAPEPVRAQPANLAVYQDLALQCLAGAPDTVRAFLLDAPAAMPYLRPALAARWQSEARTLFLPDSAAAPPGLPRLAFRVEEAAVTYARAPGRRLRRSVALGLHYTLVDASGRLLAEARCRPTYADEVDRQDVARLQSDAFPETRAALPPAGWVRRTLQPVLLTAATAVTVYLFFTLRTQATEGN